MRTLLKFATCGSVDDGKSTLIGHMLYDAKLLFTDQEKALLRDSRMSGGAIDYSLLLDGLMAEREQKITIDVAYRYFTTKRRSFIVADAPGHEEYTRNMAVAAAFANLAVILVDVTHGVVLQTRRHLRICAMMGIEHFVFAVNKMDLVNYDRATFDRVRRQILELTGQYELRSVQVIPVSATEGDNVTETSWHMPWYRGEPLLTYLEEVDVHESTGGKAFVLPVQRVCRPDRSFRGFQGQVESGEVRVGDELTVLPSGERAAVARILDAGREAESAGAGRAVTVTLNREVDVSRGCVLIRGEEPPVTNLFSAQLLWMDESPLVAGKSYMLKLGTKMLPATVMNIRHKIDVNTGAKLPAADLRKNELAVCHIAAAEKLVLDAFQHDRALGSLILIDRVTNMTSGCGVVLHPLRRADNLFAQSTDITREFRANQKGQTPRTVWLTGLSGSGKSTIANELEKRLAAMGRHTMLLDGDNIRLGLNRNLGFRESDRIENIRRIAEVAKLMNDAGLIAIVACISPYRQDRERAKEVIGADSFAEVYVNAPLEECERRDVKGLYKKARGGEIPNFTGVSSRYEPPLHPALELNTRDTTVEDCVEAILRAIPDM